MATLTNEDHVQAARGALIPYILKSMSAEGPAESDAVHMQDLLSDLMHFAAMRGMDFDDILSAAQRRYAEEA